MTEAEMEKPGHVYRKGYQHKIDAEGSANGFAKIINIDKPGPTKAWMQEENSIFYVYVELAGEMNPDEVLGATGFERVN
jgi:hypothetical protein